MDDGSRRENESIYLQGDETVRKVAIVFMITISLVFLMGCTKAKSMASADRVNLETESHIIKTTKEVYEQAKIMGDVSYCTDEWKSRVVEIRVYEKNALCDD